MSDWTGMREYESDVRGYFPSCPICGSREIAVHLTQGGRDILSCESCGARWHIYVGLTGLKWAELDVEADDGKGKELLGKRLDRREWQRMAQNARKALPRAGQSSRTKDTVVAKEKEIIREKQVIVKVRCPYCHNLHDETLDRCPHCGAKR
jgi:Zn finger protein HypA/HybF involved in hydrogenase expression